MPKATQKQIPPNFDMSFLPTDQQIKDIQEAGIPLTTKKNTEFRVKVLTSYREKHHNGIPIESVNDKKILEKQLCEFVVDQITLNGNTCKQNYPDLYKTLNGKLHDLKKQGKISTKKADTLSPDEIKQILNQHQKIHPKVFLGECLYGFDIRDDMVVFTKFHQKNDQGGLDAINDDVWYLDHKIGTEKIKNYMKTICFDAGINLNGRKIVNHSGHATSLNWLYQSGVDDTQVMTISGHKSLKGMRSYIAPTIYQKASKISNVLQMALTLQESSTLNKTPQKNTGSDKHVKFIDSFDDEEPEDIKDEDNSDEPDDMSDKGSGVKSLG
ncbi:19928_t:CDS:2, partial [Entrophospora sp. SA101]